jgi:hypothetical protein
MKTEMRTTAADGAIWDRVIEFNGDLSPPAARALLKLSFSNGDHQRMGQLSAKARAGALTPQDQREMDTFEQLGCLLDILHSKARRVLKKRRRTAG